MKSLKIQICQNNKRPSFHLRKNQSLRIRRDERLHAVAHFFQRKICKNLNLCRLSILWQNKHWLENKYLQLDLSILLPCRWSWIGRELDVWVQCKAEVGHPCCALQPIPEQELVIHLWLCTLCSLKYNARLDYTLWLALLSLHALQTSKMHSAHQQCWLSRLVIHCAVAWQTKKPPCLHPAFMRAKPQRCEYMELKV